MGNHVSCRLHTDTRAAWVAWLPVGLLRYAADSVVGKALLKKQSAGSVVAAESLLRIWRCCSRPHIDACFGTELSLPGDPVAPELASVIGVGAILHWFFVRSINFGSLLPRLSLHYAESHCLAFSYVFLDLPWVFPCDRCW